MTRGAGQPTTRNSSSSSRVMTAKANHSTNTAKPFHRQDTKRAGTLFAPTLPAYETPFEDTKCRTWHAVAEKSLTLTTVVMYRLRRGRNRNGETSQFTVILNGAYNSYYIKVSTLRLSARRCIVTLSLVVADPGSQVCGVVVVAEPGSKVHSVGLLLASRVCIYPAMKKLWPE